MNELNNNSKKSQNHIWILEDDKGCQFVYEQILKNDFTTTYFDNLKTFKECFDKTFSDILDLPRPVMIIADLMLTDGNFLSFLTTDFHGRLTSEVPFIIVFSDDDIESLRLCFREGAYDYLTKPFKKNELLVKIETILRSQHRLGRALRPQVCIDGIVVEGLTSKQQKLLNLFLDNQQRVVDRDMIIEKVWGDTSVHPKTLDVHLYNLRRKLHPYGYMIKSLGSGRWSLLSDTK